MKLHKVYGVDINLHDVQDMALQRSNGAFGFGYFLEQGLGKTLLSEVDFLKQVEIGESDRSIVVCPNSFKSGWVDEATKYDLPISQFIYTSTESQWAERWAQKETNSPKQLIINYEAIRQDNTMNFLKGFMHNREVFLTFDESIQLKNFKSLQTKAAIELASYAKYSRILSGKPIAQGPHDLWGQMKAIKQLPGFEYYPFKTMFCKMGGFKNKQVKGAQNEEHLGRIIDPHVFRATKDEWTDLPPKVYTIREYTMTPEMRAMYNQMHNEFVLWLNEDENVAVDAAITKYIKLAQIQCGWIYDEDGKERQLVDDDKNPRLNLLKSVLEHEVTGKAVIAYRHKPVLDQLMRNLGGEEKCAWIKGGMAPGEITEQKRRFNEDRGVPYILVQTVAGKYGHTLLGLQDEPEYACSTLIPYENTYSLDDRSQIEDRPHRHGQKADVMRYIDLVGTPIDKDCVIALQRKEDVFQAIMAHLRH